MLLGRKLKGSSYEVGILDSDFKSTSNYQLREVEFDFWI